MNTPKTPNSDISDIIHAITPLALMINDKGDVVNVSGVAYQGKGIFGNDDNTYPAGIAYNGEIHADAITANDKGKIIIETNSGILNPDQWDFEANYSHLLPAPVPAPSPSATPVKQSAA